MGGRDREWAWGGRGTKKSSIADVVRDLGDPPLIPYVHYDQIPHRDERRETHSGAERLGTVVGAGSGRPLADGTSGHLRIGAIP